MTPFSGCDCCRSPKIAWFLSGPKIQRSPSVHAEGVHEVPYNNVWKIFIIKSRNSDGAGQAWRSVQNVEIVWGDGRKGNARSEYLFVLSLEFITWMVKSLMEVAVTPSVSHIEGVSAKGFIEGLHCDVLELFSSAFPVLVSSLWGLGFRRMEASQDTESLHWRLSLWWLWCFNSTLLTLLLW